ncbi:MULTISPECIES: FAD binding domain-containing protein [Rhodococcus]|uniref:FAD binding domain-containing protein n=1 Tax=Rhodococcus oxybenzonivorans TaxID=1990687 RepID=A0AAE4UZZ5_9NOCA|nr:MULTISPECIES: FAD binding domain-containing protein [Rhodococcus]MDV7241256.1 FAD binding domain-containing protein [Rhodococcus oxybenzonivorans]MDV7266171.1 FAD binding domain-containing protein [Rhodococcus oxybenzonivorans]MDV7273529.1 FAD binding domain-containing protein [Rhodococcus oxybenzonivorans]MDV7332733.1 FAD binding domain-containing protein [Rhodococcus oxybenzonivorans]MDV7341899.1 FAD binding domain-containing protein [Rhodococcus oxybenzonivorans]
MDLSFVTDIATPRTRAELPVPEPGSAYLAGGTWLYSEPQPGLTHLVDLTTLGWQSVTVQPDELEVAATCTIETLCHTAYPDQWNGTSLFRPCAEALVASWKIWHTATVGGNLALGLPAGAMITACCALDAEVLLWAPDGSERRIPVLDFVTGAGCTVLNPGELIRSIHFPGSALRSRTTLRKIAYSPLGRSGALLAGRLGPDGFTLAVTASTLRPFVLRFPDVPDFHALDTALAEHIPLESYFTDAHGVADWRRHVTAVLAEEIREELA